MRPILTNRQFRTSDRGNVVSLLSDIGEKYLGGEAWLDQKLDASLAGVVDTVVYELCGRLVGATIVTPKGKGSVKLSTFKVAAPYRNVGIGSQMLERLEINWLKRDVFNAWVTVDAQDVSTTTFFEQKGGWCIEGYTAKFYRPETHDAVLNWHPHQV